MFVDQTDINQLWDKQGLLVGEGLYTNLNNTVEVLVCNHSNEVQTIPACTLIGYGREVNPSTRFTLPPSEGEVGALPGEDESPPEERRYDKLTNEQKQAWTVFITRELRLDENKILQADQQLKERVILAFLRNLGAIARNSYDFGNTNLAKMHIEIKPGATPVKARVRPLNPLQEKDLQRQVDEWLQAGVIEEANGPWSSGLVPVAKKNTETLRWCVDYRALNQVTVKDNYPLPNIPNTLNKLAGSEVFSTWDSRGAYHSLKLSPESSDYTAFVSPIGLFRFICTPFGLCNAGQVYSRMINHAIVLTRNQQHSLAYLDDVITHSTSNANHAGHVKRILEMHAKFGLKLNLRKCQIFESEVQYLGHLVSSKGIKMLDSHVTKILEWKKPRTGKELQSFLGFANYYAAFIPEFGRLTAAMNTVRNVKGDIDWTTDMTKDFEELKTAFSKSPTRAYPDFSEGANPFILDTDYSSICCGAILSQVQNGRGRFIACAASKNNGPQSVYPSYKGELLAIITAIKKFEHLLQMRKFILRTDSSAMKYLGTLKEFRGIFARWQLYLAEFDFDVLHRAGTSHVNADRMSRRSDVSEATPVFDEDISVILHTPSLRPPVIHEISRQSLREMTSNDETLGTVIKLLSTGKPTLSERWALSRDVKRYVDIYECLKYRDGVVYFVTPNTQSKASVDRICLPERLKKHVWLATHTAGGHLGTNKTAEQIANRFYFPNIRSYVEMQIRNCVTCIAKLKALPRARHVPYRSVYGSFNETVFVDTVGPITPAGIYNGKRVHHFLTVQDAWTRFLVAVPIPDVSTKTIAANIIEMWIHRYSCPIKMHSDNGTGFTSKLMQEIMKMFNIQRTYTPPYSPSGNRVERSHKLLGQLLRTDDTGRSVDWVKNLNTALFVYNTTVNRFTGLSPLEALTTSKPHSRPSPRTTSSPTSRPSAWATVKTTTHSGPTSRCLGSASSASSSRTLTLSPASSLTSSSRPTP